MPGSALVELWEAIRRDGGLRTVTATSELTASFMANGYARATGRPAALCTIGGPGLTFAASGVAEAHRDSTPLLYILVLEPHARTDSGRVAGDAELGAVLAKDVFEARAAAEIGPATRAALTTTRAGEPGPVALVVTTEALRGLADRERDPLALTDRAESGAADLDEISGRLARARRPVLLVGAGAADAGRQVTELAEKLRAPVLTTTSGRGVVSEAHPFSLPEDFAGVPPRIPNEILSRADVVLALGCKLTRNGTRGHALMLPSESLIRVDSSRAVLDSNYPASVSMEADVEAVVEGLVVGLDRVGSSSEWTVSDVASARRRLHSSVPQRLDPIVGPGRASEFFSALRGCLPDDAVVTTDSGLHQYYVRAHLQVLRPRTLLVPADFQSMGFGIPAAIGAGVATRGPVVAVTGDAGFAIVGMEILTAIREEVPLTVIVFVDGYLGLIRLSQLARVGRTTDVSAAVPRLELFARSIDAAYARLDGSRETYALLDDAIASRRVTILEVPTGDPPGARRLRAGGRVRGAVRGLLARL